MPCNQQNQMGAPEGEFKSLRWFKRFKALADARWFKSSAEASRLKRCAGSESLRSFEEALCSLRRDAD
jgi:hypothetical protein